MEMNNKIRVASLFAGIGGADLGLLGGFAHLGRRYLPNNFTIVFANDIDNYAVETYNKNFERKACREDICNISSEDLPDHDLLVGGFPCQPFSVTVAGLIGHRRGILDGRGRLFLEMARIIRDKKPKAFVAENVKGIISSNSGRDFKVILAVFSNIGYDVSWKVLNAADYGVPQKRERVFIVGVRSDLGVKYVFPEPTHSENGGDGLKKWIPLRRALDGIVPKDKKYVFSKRALRGLARANKAFNKGRAQDLNGPCATISTHLAKVSLNGTDPVIRMPDKGFRRLTPKEAARIQSFPASYKFMRSDLVRYRQIGNAIPPVLFWHIAKTLELQIFRKIPTEDRRLSRAPLICAART